MGAMMDAANGLIDELGSNANVGLVSYSTSASLDQELTGSHGDVQSTINGLSGGGQTHIVDGVETAQDELHNGPNARSGADKIMVVMSDGEHNQSGDPVVAADDAKSDGTELYTVGFGSADASTLQSMASNPWDVHYFDAADDDELIDAFSQIGQAIAGERVIFEGTLAELMGISRRTSGIPLDGDRETEYNEVEAGAPAAGDGEGRALRTGRNDVRQSRVGTAGRCRKRGPDRLGRVRRRILRRAVPAQRRRRIDGGLTDDATHSMSSRSGSVSGPVCIRSRAGIFGICVGIIGIRAGIGIIHIG